MATNPYINKVQYGGNTLIDLTGDTAQAGDVHTGYSFHDRSGASVNGTFDFATATSGTATSADLPYGKSLWVNGQLVEGDFEVPTFADGTDEEIATALQMHYAGEIDLTDYWSVGDKRTIHLNVMTADGVSEAHHADDYEFVIIGMNHDDLVTPIGNITKAIVTLQMDRILYKNTTDATYSSKYPSVADEGGYMNSTSTNVGGWTSCARRTWCNSVFYNAVESGIKSLIKPVVKKTSAGNQSSVINSDNDNVFLLSEIEVFGSTQYSFAGEGSQYSYFTTATNRYKKPSYSSYASAYWRGRSPYYNDSSKFSYVTGNGVKGGNTASGTYGICPAFCL